MTLPLVEIGPFTGNEASTVQAITPGAVPIPVQNADGSFSLSAAQNIFPTQSVPQFQLQANIGNSLATKNPVADVFNPGGMQQALINTYLNNIEQNVFVFGTKKAGCKYKIEVYARRFNYTYNEPDCKLYLFIYDVLPSFLVQTYYAEELPVIKKTLSLILPPYSAMCYGFKYLLKANIIIPAPPDSPEYPNPYAMASAQASLFDVQVIATAQNCLTPQTPAGDKPLTAIPPATAPTIPAQLPAIPKPGSCTPCVIEGGAVTTAPPGQAGAITFVPSANGTYTANVAMPNCTCKDGVTPTLSTGIITANANLPLSVKLRQVGSNAYALDMNIPPSVPAFVPLTVSLPYTDQVTGIEGTRPVTLYAPSDGTNDCATAFGWILEQLLELRSAKKTAAIINPSDQGATT